MRTVTRNAFVPFARHFRADITMYVRHLAGGTVAHEGAGASFWFRPRVAAISQLPLDDREQSLLFHTRTADFADVTVAATVNFRIVDPALAASRIDFSIDPYSGAWNGLPLETLGGLLTELAQQPALEFLATLPMREALASGLGPVRDRMADALAGDPRLAERGIAVTDVRVIGLRVDAELERALQTETREQVQQQADRATFERRARAVERERAIAENELANKIELSRRENDLVTQDGTNNRTRATEMAAASAIATESAAAQRRLGAEAEAQAIRVVGQATGEAERAKYEASVGIDPAILTALALRELAANMPAIDSLTITPDLLAPVLSRLAATPAAPAPVAR